MKIKKFSNGLDNITLKLETTSTNTKKFFKDMENIVLELQATGTETSMQQANAITKYINLTKDRIGALKSMKTDKK
jgi:hypothetical protein